jgi:septal ring factor EnvC (AmiA/AmiB activator)
LLQQPHLSRPSLSAQLEDEKAAASDKQSRVIDELRGAQTRLRELERELKALQAQQKGLAGQKQVGRWAGVCRIGLGSPAWAAVIMQQSRLRRHCLSTWLAALQDLAAEKEVAQRKKASAELDVADLEDKLRSNEGECKWGG